MTDNFEKLSTKELCFLHLADFLEQIRLSPSKKIKTRFCDELAVRTGAKFDTFEEYVQEAKSAGLISEFDYHEIATAIKVKDITEKALKKLHV